ncbi:hypothetical protein Lal_00014005 [Lupinus albus]|nr:hypothetical protein Lal_00014005 [Lupinus albus]
MRSLYSYTPQSQINAYLGHYLMELSIGTPPTNIYAVLDSGSDLIWTQCVPCNNCYKQLNPMFAPQLSSTYSNMSCESEQCHKLDTTLCSLQNNCNYTYAYASASMTQGVLAQETITLTSTTGEPVSIEGIIFGCGHNNTGSFNDHEMGIIGIGGGPMSLISQIGYSFGSKKFSQCLVPFHSDISISSKMSFGDGSDVLGDDVVSTPLVTKEDNTPYFVTLLGTPPTILPQQLYDKVVNEVRNQIALEPIENDQDLGSQLCYRTTIIQEVPVLIAHFEGADVQLTSTQTFIPTKDGVFCLGLTNTSSDGGIYGNFAQTNYLIGFDLERQIVSFKPIDCTKQ